ncbi:hypothetical protein SGRIM128S_01268 [Streptomyces griseomycini]
MARDRPGALPAHPGLHPPAGLRTGVAAHQERTGRIGPGHAGDAGLLHRARPAAAGPPRQRCPHRLDPPLGRPVPRRPGGRGPGGLRPDDVHHHRLAGDHRGPAHQRRVVPHPGALPRGLAAPAPRAHRRRDRGDAALRPARGRQLPHRRRRHRPRGRAPREGHHRPRPVRLGRPRPPPQRAAPTAVDPAPRDPPRLGGGRPPTPTRAGTARGRSAGPGAGRGRGTATEPPEPPGSGTGGSGRHGRRRPGAR